MTRTVNVECDKQGCDNHRPIPDDDVAPPNWSVVGSDTHVCPEHEGVLETWIEDGVSEGRALTVRHKYPDDVQLETAHVEVEDYRVNVGTPLFLEADWVPDDRREEPFVIALEHHLHLWVFGLKGDDPTVVIEDGKNETDVVMLDQEDTIRYYDYDSRGDQPIDLPGTETDGGDA